MAVKAAFKDHAYKLAISSTKSNTGHLLGASGAVEAIISIKSLQEGFIPATINYQESDPDCDLDIVANQGRHQDIHYAMSNSLGFGGHNASLVFKNGRISMLLSNEDIKRSFRIDIPFYWLIKLNPLMKKPKPLLESSVSVPMKCSF